MKHLLKEILEGIYIKDFQGRLALFMLALSGTLILSEHIAYWSSHNQVLMALALAASAGALFVTPFRGWKLVVIMPLLWYLGLEMVYWLNQGEPPLALMMLYFMTECINSLMKRE